MRSQIFSIFGQIEGVVADQMAAEGIVTKIELDMIPRTAKWDEHGRLAHCALIMTPEIERVFDQRVRDLRA
jgi:hypothetical protein